MFQARLPDAREARCLRTAGLMSDPSDIQQVALSRALA